VSDEDKILASLAKSHVTPIGKPVQDGSDAHQYYTFVNVSRNRKGHQQPSNYALKKLAEELQVSGITIHFVLIENGAEDLKNSIKSMLFRNYQEALRNVFSTIDQHGVEVWIEPKKALTSDATATLTAELNTFLEHFRMRLKAVRFTTESNLPAQSTCLRVARILAPASLARLREELLKRGFHVPNDDWLSLTFDKLRKAGFVIRKKDGEYSLTLAGLKSLGSAKDRRSPDIVRSLALARRGE
jgi:hypothetical protein